MAIMVGALDPAIPRHPLTVHDEQRMVDAGVFDDGARVELLEGALIAMSPQGPGHATGTSVLAEILRRAHQPGAYVREQQPLYCGTYNLPEPDLAVVRGRPQDHRARHPGGDETLLVVEVSRSSQRVDRVKARIYARAAVPEYWIVDLQAREVVAHREPSSEGYRAIDTLDEHATLHLPRDVHCAVAELLF
jgi:Uma2 family endonuclease